MIETEEYDLTPRAETLYESYLNDVISHEVALSELIDNSFDWGATNVDILLKSNSITVKDDGIGCEDPSRMVTIGDHEPGAHTRLGRYGVGAKIAICGLGDAVEIKTIHAGIERFIKMPFRRRVDHKLTGDKQPSTELSGTEIFISPLHGIHLSDAKFEKLKSEIAFRFAPALTEGKRITINFHDQDHVLAADALPEFQESIGSIGSPHQYYENPWGFDVTGGIIKRGQPINDRKAFIVTYAHRVIFETDAPCAPLSASERFVAWVQLKKGKGDWPLTKLKDGLSEEGSDWLYKRLHKICEPLLKKVHAEGESLQLEELNTVANEDYAAMTGREARKRGKTHGTKKRKGTKIKRINATLVNPGPGPCHKPHNGKTSGVDIRYGDLGSIIGNVRPIENRLQVTLNQEHPAIKLWKSKNDKTFLRYTAASLVASFGSRSAGPGPQIFIDAILAEDDHGTFINALGSFCNQITEKAQRRQK